MPSAALDTEYDVLVIGSGAAGLAAAVTAAWHGQRVIVVEKEPVFGGATAWSGGWAWVPRNPLAQRAGIVEDIEQPRTYLRHELGTHYNAERVDAFLEACPHMVAFFEKHTALQFADGNGIPDMHGDTPGAAQGGHQVIAAPYDAREVGALLPRLRKTLRETSFMGMPIMAGADLAAFLNMTRSPKALLHVCKRFGRHLYHLARYGRAMHLVNGVALVARLAKSAQDLGVHLQESAPAKSLLVEDGRVCGARVATPQGERQIRAKAVVLAAGGFPNDSARRQQLFPRDASGHDNLALPPQGCSGDGLRLGEAAGGVVATNLKSPVAWAPVSRVPHRDGSIGHFPHIIERGKPGIIGVLANGKRFVNEAHGYYDYVSAWSRQSRRVRKCARGWCAIIASCAALAWAMPARHRCRCGRMCAAVISSGVSRLKRWRTPVALNRPGCVPRSATSTNMHEMARTRHLAVAPRRSTANRVTRSTRAPTRAWRPSNTGRSMQ